jgi:shikimate kinase/3-dehydroquinate synthase
MTSNLYIVGFMGAGKNAVGQRLAEILNRKFVDMDDLLEEQFGMPIRDFFAHYGETAFRDAETALLRRLSRRKRLVIATGGGVPEREANRRVMNDSGTIVHLDVRLETCMHRLTPEDQAARPKWQDKDSLERLYERRKAMYADCGLRMAGDGGQPAETARAILQELHPDHRFSAVLGDMSCQTICTWKAEEVLKEFVSGWRPVILIDRTVARHHLERYSKPLESPLVVEIPPGERSKTLKRALGIYETLLQHRFERGDLLIAIGGGVVTDLGAFVASTFKRGMNLVLVATSLLACVDAAIGGKAAVNLRQAKNAVGCFATPMGVLLDIYSLRTLPRAGIAEGLVEAYKTGLVAEPQLAAFIEQEILALNAKDLPALAQAAMLSAKAKTAVVGSDFREEGLRRILNFGHTFGHAIEAWSRFRINHGRAVAVGMIVAMRLSVARGLLAEDTAGGIMTTLKSIVRGKFVCPPLEKAWEIMRHDKKVQRGRIVFVLLEGVGRPVCVDDVSKEELESAIEAVERML